MITNEFAALVEDLGAFIDARDAGRMAKASAPDWIEKWHADVARAPVVDRQRQAARRTLGREIAQTVKQADVMLKSLPGCNALAQPASRREQFAKSFSRFNEAVAAGRLTAHEACVLQAKYHRLAQAL